MKRHASLGALVLAATLAGGCSGAIDGNGPGGGNDGAGSGSGAGDGNGNQNGNGVGSGGTSAGTGGVNGSGTGATNGADGPEVCVPGIPGTSQLPRLTNAQYDNTIQALTGLSSTPSTMLAPDKPGSVDQRTWDGYTTAAEALAAEVMADANARSQVIPCSPAPDEAGCVRQLIEQFGRRAFRRPLTPDEVARFEGLYASRAEITATGSFDEVAQLIIKAFLLSPSFLTRAEIAEQPEGDLYVLNGYEVASRLSYMIWGSMPDEALFQAAADGSLSTSDGILAQAQRMLQDGKARRLVAAFHERYAHMGEGTRWSTFTRDTSLYPAFSDALIPQLVEETEALFDHIVFDLGGSFRDLLTSPVALVNASTAPLYGLNSADYGSQLTPVTLDAATRPGIFTRLGFLASHASFNRTSPILRGAFLQKEILCKEIPPPPPDVEGTPLPSGEGLITNRQKVDAQTAAPTCANCHHEVINPTGFALESFDAVGAIQATDNGAPVDTVASVLIGEGQVEVTGPADLMNAIASSPEAQRCYTKKWVSYAYEREANSMDSCTVNTLAQKLTQDGYTVVNLIADLTQTDAFRMRAVEVTP